ncbi:MAG: hypothetical protein KF903_07770 [Dokdonella sp.]|uniref:hypothetical protein n=1 Tax=Dokdonella sp. TaxID=2291710 RepID=UPI0025C14CF4|nr:hypothetical protein [Dokdonella sp.]MBX3700876.1 hypothetical protein [Dokdonella sp.]MCW5579175.1 hypothetical protein [Dokdonella sp.]
MKSAPTIAFDYAPSRRLFAALALVTALATLAPWLSALGWPACVTLDMLVLGGAATAAGRLRRPRFRRIAHQAAGWVLLDRDGGERLAGLVDWRQLGDMVTLDWRVDRRRRFRIVLAPDNLDADTRRRLVLLLRSLGPDADATAPLR